MKKFPISPLASLLLYWSVIFFIFVWFFLGSVYWPKIWHFFLKIGGLSPSVSEANTYINPESVLEKSRTKYVPFELKTSKRIFEEINRNKDVSLFVYVRNLDNGPWFGIGEHEPFAPIRSLKMPLFISYLKWSEKNPDILNTVLTIPQNDEKSSVNQFFIPKNKLETNQSYSVSRLLEEMMVNSNDIATSVLLKNIPYSLLSQVDVDLWVLLPGEEDIDDTISLKEYSSFFRILYNADYLSPASSEFALSLLAKTDFPQGIRKWIPSRIRIANKFWEKISLSSSGEKIYQLHDCWVVYYTAYPYLICISAKSSDIAKLPNVIGETSRIVFEEISIAYPGKF
jgi:beta-lactamase class A